MEANIKRDLKLHLDRTAEMIRRDNDWHLIDIPDISESGFMQIASKHGKV